MKTKTSKTLTGRKLLLWSILAALAPAIADAAQRPAEPWPAPASARRIANPIKASPDVLQAGKSMFTMACLPCHGDKGKGDGVASASLEVRPGDLSRTVMWQQTDGELFWKLNAGKTPMPAFKGTVPDEDLWKIIHFVRSFAPKPADGVIAQTVTTPEPKPVPTAKPVAPSTGGEFVSRAEYDKLRSELELIKAQLGGQAPLGLGGVKALTAEEWKAHTSEIESHMTEIRAARDLAEKSKPGNNQQLLAGYGFVRYSDAEGANSDFNAGFNPIFLWKRRDRLFFEGELELGLEDGATEVGLEYAQMSYVLNDYFTIGGGKFLSPNNYFIEKLHPAWINKLPDKPLMFEGNDRLLAPSQLGVQLRGAAPIGNGKINYALYGGNGPVIRTSLAAGAPPVGTLNFNNWPDNNNNKSVGGRLGIVPLPEMELGYGFEVAQVSSGAVGIPNVDAVSHTVDFNYVRDSAKLGGTIDLKAQVAWVRLDNPGIAPLIFNNDRFGGYTQLAYRPTKAGIEWLRNCEAVGRYDWIDLPDGAPSNLDQRRVTLGLNYWVGPAAVVKAAYQFGDQKAPGVPRNNIAAWLLEAAFGF